MLFRIFISIIFYLASSLLCSAEQKTLEQDIEGVTKRAQEMKVPSFEKDERASEAARNIYEYTLSEEFLNAVQEHRKNLEQIINSKLNESENVFDKYYSQYKVKKSVLNSDERIYIFVSSSIPEYTLKKYVQRVAKMNESNIYFVLRGFISGISRMTPTVRWIYNNIKKDEYCNSLDCELYPVKFIVDPFLFSKYNINAVPAVVYVKGLKNELLGSEGLDSVKVSNFWVSYGDVPLEYHLKLIEEKSGKKFF